MKTESITIGGPMNQPAVDPSLPVVKLNTEHLKQSLMNQFALNNIKAGTIKAMEFEYAFIIGIIAYQLALGEEPSAWLTITAMSGRSILD